MAREMKDSGIDWIGQIPKDWHVEQVGRNIKAVDCPNIDNVEQNALQFKMGSIISKKNGDSKYNPLTMEAYNRVKEGDIVINGLNLSFDLISQRVGMVREQGVITSTYLTVRPSSNISSSYLTYLFKAYDNCKAFHGMGRGLRATLAYRELRSEKVFYPSLSEQRLIADYLDTKCSEIDELVALQDKMIDELKAYKQSVITEAVTKGLDKNVKMKDSGVDWIGEVPEHWEVKRTKNFVISMEKGNGITKEEVFANGDTPCVRYGEIYSKYDYSFKSCYSATNKDVLSTLRYFQQGDLLCAGTGELVEEIGKTVAYMGNINCLAGGDIIIIKHQQNPMFMSYALNSHYAQSQKSCGKAKLKVVHISASDIANVMLAVPSPEEQEKIATYLDTKCSEIDNLIAIKQKKIEELKEYKKSLIYECVTGKKEVV